MYQRSLGDRHVAWQDLTSAGDQVAPDLTREQAIARFHVRRADGSLASGAGAFLAIWRNSKRLKWLAAALDRQPFLWFGDRLYSLFLAVRPLWRPKG